MIDCSGESGKVYLKLQSLYSYFGLVVGKTTLKHMKINTFCYLM